MGIRERSGCISFDGADCFGLCAGDEGGVGWTEAGCGGLRWLECSAAEEGGGFEHGVLHGATVAEVALSVWECAGVSSSCGCGLWSAFWGIFSGGLGLGKGLAWLPRKLLQTYCEEHVGARENKVEFAGNFARCLVLDERCREDLREMITSLDGVANWDRYLKAARKADLRCHVEKRGGVLRHQSRAAGGFGGAAGGEAEGSGWAVGFCGHAVLFVCHWGGS